jgi:hypothetical protein
VHRQLAALGLSGIACLAACDKGDAQGELNKSECLNMVVRIDKLKNGELGRVNNVEERGAIDHCMKHGTRAQAECVNFANNAGELARCSELEK